MNEISGRRVAGFLGLSLLIVLATLGFAVVVSPVPAGLPGVTETPAFTDAPSLPAGAIRVR